MVCGFEVNIGGTVDAKYNIPALDVVDHSTFKRIGVRHRSSAKLEFTISVPDSTLRFALMLNDNTDTHTHMFNSHFLSASFPVITELQKSPDLCTVFTVLL